MHVGNNYRIRDFRNPERVVSRHQCGSRSPLGARWWRRTMNLTMMKTNPLNTKLTFEHPLTHMHTLYGAFWSLDIIISQPSLWGFFVYTCTKIFLYIHVHTHAWLYWHMEYAFFSLNPCNCWSWGRVYKRHEDEKKQTYGQRILEIEHVYSMDSLHTTSY